MQCPLREPDVHVRAGPLGPFAAELACWLSGNLLSGSPSRRGVLGSVGHCVSPSQVRVRCGAVLATPLLPITLCKCFRLLNMHPALMLDMDRV